MTIVMTAGPAAGAKASWTAWRHGDGPSASKAPRAAGHVSLSRDKKKHLDGSAKYLLRYIIWDIWKWHCDKLWYLKYLKMILEWSSTIVTIDNYSLWFCWMHFMHFTGGVFWMHFTCNENIFQSESASCIIANCQGGSFWVRHGRSVGVWVQLS